MLRTVEKNEERSVSVSNLDVLMKRKGDSLSALSSLGLIVLKDDIVNFMKYPAISQITCLQKKSLSLDSKFEVYVFI